MTPYQALTGTTSNLSNLRTFGCRIYAKRPGKRPAKLDHHTSNEIFLGYTSSMQNVYYIDNVTHTVKIGVHAMFDEAHFTVPKCKAPLTAQALQCLGYSKPNDIFDNRRSVCTKTIDIHIIHKDATSPFQAETNSGMIRLYSSSNSVTILPTKHMLSTQV